MKFRHSLPLVLLYASFAFAADTPAQAPSSVPRQPIAQSPEARQAKAAAAHSVAPTAPVITIEGVCNAPTSSARHRECKVSVTRQQFEHLLSSLPQGPGQVVTPAGKRQFATQYSRQLILSAEAQKRGLQNTPEGRILVEYAQSQALAQMLGVQIRNANRPTEEEARKFYEANKARYSELTLQRVYVPVRMVAPGKTNEAEMRALVDDLHTRAEGVADFSALQEEATQKADIKSAPSSKITLPASALPTGQQAAAELKEGELSAVIQDPSGFTFFRLEARRTQVFEAAAVEIIENLTEQKVQMQVDKLLAASKPVLNAQYFQPTSGLGKHAARKTITLPQQRPMVARPASAPAN